MNIIPFSLYAEFAANGCKYNVAKTDNNVPKCADLEIQVNNLIAGLNPYDLFRTTYGNGDSLKATSERHERKL